MGRELLFCSLLTALLPLSSNLLPLERNSTNCLEHRNNCSALSLKDFFFFLSPQQDNDLESLNFMREREKKYFFGILEVGFHIPIQPKELSVEKTIE